MLNPILQSRAAACLLACAALLSACGGGANNTTSNTNPGANPGANTGANTGSGNTTPPAATPALSFWPSVATASLVSGSTSTLMVSANVVRPADFGGNVYATIVDNAGVLLPNARIEAQTETQYTAILHTSTTLAAGSYKGNFTVNLCKDQACSQHFPGSPIQLPYEFTVAAAQSNLTAMASAPLSQTVNMGAPAPAPVMVTVSGTQLSWTASSNVPWLVLKNASGTGNGAFTVLFDNSQSVAGSQSGAITVTASDGKRVELNAVLTTLGKAFTVTQGGFSFTAINGAPIASQQVSFNLDGGGTWTAGSDASWLSANPASGTLPGQLGLTVDPAKGALASGNYTGKLTLQSPGAADRSLNVSLNLVKPMLSASSESVVLGGPYGRDFSAKPLTMYLSTLKNSWPWTFSTLPAWANASANAGVANMDGTTVQFTANLNAIPAGSKSALVTATAKVNGDTLTRSIALTVNRDQEKFLPSETGVAMVSVPGWSRLVRTLTVSDNYGAADTDWWPSSDQPWLHAVRSGDTLTLTGDPSLLPSDAISYATVTLTHGSSGITTPESVRVALWKGSQAPLARTEIAGSYWKVLADAIRPLVYVHSGGNILDVFNVYTGQKVASSGDLLGALGDMAMSQNGERLYVYDTSNHSVVVLNAQTLARLDTWTLSRSATPTSRLISVRPNGEEFLLTTSGDAFRVSTGKRVPLQLNGAMDATRDGKRLYVQDTLLSPSTTLAYNLDFTEIAGGTFHVATAGSFSAGANGADVAVSLDGNRVYTANANRNFCGVNDGVTLKSLNYLPGGSLYPNSVKVDSFGRVYCGAAGLNTAVDIWLHDSKGAQLKQFKLSSNGAALQYRQMAVSADGMMLIGLTQTPAMSIMAVGP